MLTDLICYDLKVAALIVVFYLFYMLLLARETTHTLNRVVLLCSIFLSTVLPLCIITIHKSIPITSLPTRDEYADLLKGVPQTISTTDVTTPLSLGEGLGVRLLFAVLLIGTIIRLLYLAQSYRKLMEIIRNGEKHTLPSGMDVCVVEDNVAPFSWMNTIVLSQADWQLQSASILAHEEAHVRHRHSYDIVVVEILTALQWFNPVVWFMRQELRILHEYEADASVLSHGFNESQYIHLLMQKAKGIQACVLANGIHTPKTKKRIIMMLKKKSKRSVWLKALYVVPIVLVSLAMTAKTVVNYETTLNDNNSAIRVFHEKTNGRGDCYQIRHQPGVKFFRNGKEEQIPQGRNISLEVSKTTMLVDGKPIDQFTLLDVPATGELKEIHLTENNSNHYVCNLKTTGAMKYSLKMSDTEFVVYVKEHQAAGLSNGDLTQEMLNEAGSISRAHILHLNSVYGSKKSYLFIVDGKEVSSEEFCQLPSNAIVSAKVMDVGPAKKAYGEKGRRGATVIKTKEKTVYIVDGELTSEEAASKIQKEDITFVDVISTAEDIKKAYHVDADKAVVAQTKQQGDDPVFDVVENLPQFPGGEMALMQFIARNIKYPAKATEWGVQARVLVQFIVEKDGSLTHPKVIYPKVIKTINFDESADIAVAAQDKDMTEQQRKNAEIQDQGIKEGKQALFDEAIRVVNTMPKWIPGKQNGKIVRCKFTIPITYRLR